MGFLSVPNLVPWLIFRAWIVTDQFLWIRVFFNLTGRGKQKEKMARGVGRGVIILGSWFFRIFLSKGGNYSREVINQGTTIIIPAYSQPTFFQGSCLHFFLFWSNMWIPDRNYSQFAQFSNYTLCWPPKVLHSLCVSFLLGITVVLRKIEDTACAKFRGANKVYYGKCSNGILVNWDTKLTFGDAATGFLAKWCLRNERRNSILMTCRHPDLGSASDWSCRMGNLFQLIRSTTQIWVVSWQCQTPRQLLKNNNSCQVCS